jgi:hypothetical protein
VNFLYGLFEVDDSVSEEKLDNRDFSLFASVSSYLLKISGKGGGHQMDHFWFLPSHDPPTNESLLVP